MRKLGIEFISAFAMPPPALAGLAADLGCANISVVLEPLDYNPEGFPAWSLRNDKALRRELLAVMRDRGIAISLGEGFLVSPEIEADAYKGDLDVMAELGAERISAISFDPDLPRSFDQFGMIAEMAAKAGLVTVTEFAPCFSVPDLPTAVAAAQHVNRPDFRITVDTMHLVRSGGCAADVAALDPNLIGYVQLCDAPRAPKIESYMEEATFERLAPGQGELPLLEILKVLPDHAPIGVEIPQRSKADAGLGPEARIRPCIEAARRLLAEVEATV
jgi:sugar phosphate isomerase/epimerase